MDTVTRMSAQIERHQAALLAFLRRRLPAEAEEMAQEVWLRVARAAPTCPTEEAFRAYAFAVARRLLVDQHRRRSARIHLVATDEPVLDIPSGQPQPDAFGDADAVLAVVERTLAAMKPELAEVFVLRTARHVSFRDIAEQQGVSINTALGRMHQAVAKLHAALTTHDLLPGGLR